MSSARGPNSHSPMLESAFATASARSPRSLAPISSMTWTSRDDAQIAAAFDVLKQRWDGLDGLVHSIGFAPREAIAGDFLEGLSRESFRIAHDISSYSFPALAKAALPLMEGRKASLLTLTYLGSTRAVPNYNTMGLAKASLEASVRYLAASLGPRGIRVNGISAGPSARSRPRVSRDFRKFCRPSRALRLCGAMSRSKTSVMWRHFCSLILRPVSPPRSHTSMAASTP